MALTYPLKKINHEPVALYIITVINNKIMTFSKKNKYGICISNNIPTFTITHTHTQTHAHVHTHTAAEEMAATASSLSC